MKLKKLPKYCACVGLITGALSLSPAAHATFIDNTTYTTDTTSGLEWLDLSSTDGMSYNAVSAAISGGSLTGWRYASALEVRTMIGNFTGVTITDLATTLFPVGTYGHPLAGLLTLMGASHTDGNGQYANGLTSTILPGSVFEGISIRYLTNGAADRVFAGSQPAYNLAAAATNVEVASFLVRDNAPPAVVPEPGMAALLGLGMLGLIASRRRKQ
jgi:hypothetical protein